MAKKFKECSELRNYIGEQHLSQYIFESACGNAKVLLAVSILLNTDAQYHRFNITEKLISKICRKINEQREYLRQHDQSSENCVRDILDKQDAAIEELKRFIH